MVESVCERLTRMLREQFSNGFDRDLDELLKLRGRQLCVIGIDTEKQELTDVCGAIDPKYMGSIRHTFVDTDAGFKADAHEKLGLQGVAVDVFLLNTDHFPKHDDFIAPLMVHELAHYMDQIPTEPHDVDRTASAAPLSFPGDGPSRHDRCFGWDHPE